ncbi:MAG: arsenate reductase ArsC [Luteitalea sp.]|nr:arsenate reductase ArsC [Luteitalea sp.]
MESPKPRVLILCTGNSARSQMAEGLLRAAMHGQVAVFSAGTKPTTVRPEAIAVMAELGIDISGHRSKHVDELSADRFDYVITVCGAADGDCPVFPNAPRRIHWNVPDPAAVEGNLEKRLEAFRRISDALADSLDRFARANLR